MQDEIFTRGKEVRLSWSEPQEEDTVYNVTVNVVTRSSDTLFLTAPRNAKDFPIRRRTEISVFVILANHDVEEYSTVFEGVEEEGSIFPMWALRYPLLRVSVKRINKRGFFRLDLRTPFSFCRIENEAVIPTEYPFQAESINLSGGGMRAYMPFRLEVGEILEVMLALDPYRIIVRCEVILQRPLRQGSRYFAEVALRFFSHDHASDHEELLVRYVTREQLNRASLNI